MLITKTFCRPGSLIYIVPTGLLVSLRYYAHGSLNLVAKGFFTHGDAAIEDAAISDDFRKAIVKAGLVPGSVKFTVVLLLSGVYSTRMSLRPL